LIRSLLDRKRTREQEQAFVIEGVRPITELVRKQSPAVILLAVSRAFLLKQPPQVVALLRRSYAPVYESDDATFNRLSEVESTPGILAIVRKPLWAERAVFDQPCVLGLFGEQLQDPANVGTLIRTATAFGIDALWLTPDSADVFSPKIVRATAGAVLSLPIFHCVGPELFVQHHCAVLAAEPPSSKSVLIRQIHTMPARAVVAVGNESRGLARATSDMATVRFHIPIEKEVESLNVAAAAAIALFYLRGLPRVPSPS
jgi:TrmH family RNA methyltransferase